MATEKKREKTAQHYWLDLNGSPVDDIEKAAGIRYESGSVVGDNWVGGEKFDYLVPGAVPGEVATMGACFGFRTKATNCASGNRNAKDGPKFANDLEAIRAFFSDLAVGTWPAADGGVGRGYDLDKLCAAAGEVMARKKKPFNVEKVRKALDDGGTIAGKALDAKQYRAAIAGIEGVRAAYERLMGKTTSVEEIGDDLG